MMKTEFKKFKKEMRQAIADYMRSEGCSCCENTDAHREHEIRIAKMLNVKKYSDNSGYDFAKHRTTDKK